MLWRARVTVRDSPLEKQTSPQHNNNAATMTGPIFQLHILGSICPCFLSSERRNVYQAIQFLNHNCRRVQWHPPEAKAKNGGGLFSPSSWFQRSSDDENGATGEGEETASGPYLAVLVLRDSPNGKPVLCIQPAVANNNSKTKQRPIPLRRIDTVSLDNDAIVGYGKKQAGVPAARELLRFVPLQYSSDDDNHDASAAIPVPSDIRNMLLHHCMVLIEWERQRALESLEDEDDDDEDEHRPNFLQAQAQKAKHFATRELELQRTQKEREKRKAQLVAQTGGLKYTAIAMANQQR